MENTEQKKKFLIAIRVFESVETCLLEFKDRMALEMVYADLKEKYCELVEKVKDPETDDR